MSKFSRLYNDPVYFASEVLGVTLWSRQIEIVQATVRNSRVAVRSGHKIGKSLCVAVLALWYASTRSNARVILTSASARQVREILWREVVRLYRGARVSLGGVLHDDPNSGLRFDDGSQILGFSTDEPERMAGISGAHLLFIVDEASGVPEPIFEAIEGNRAGGARLVMFSNPTQTVGTFFDAFNAKSRFYYCVKVSSEETPNAMGLGNIPGLANIDWIKEKREEWGPDYLRSPLYQVRVLGEFPTRGDNSVMSLSEVTAAEKRESSDWRGDIVNAGLDPARFGDDESSLAIVKGTQALPIVAWSQLDGPQLAAKVIAKLDATREGKRVACKVDVIGVGASVFDALKYNRPEWLSVVAVNASNKSTDKRYHLVRDHLWFNLREWIKDASLPHDQKLISELLAPTYDLQGGKIKVEPKAATKKRLGRSPDRADALALAVYEYAVSIQDTLKTLQKLHGQLKRAPRGTV